MMLLHYMRIWNQAATRTRDGDVRMAPRGYGATAARLTPDQKVGSSNLCALICAAALKATTVPSLVFGQADSPPESGENLLGSPDDGRGADTRDHARQELSLIHI